MRSLFIFLGLLFISGCTDTPEVPTSNVVIVQDQIQSNKIESQKAKEEYLALQKKRKNN
jgi:NADH:ubiquinone oxidoreductase subunit B-like Fe-S oxidoreductase